MRRGVVGALASGDARVRRACGAVRKGARAEAGWCRAPHARAEGFMGVRLRTFRLPGSNAHLQPMEVASEPSWLTAAMSSFIGFSSIWSPATRAKAPALRAHMVGTRLGCALGSARQVQ